MRGVWIGSMMAAALTVSSALATSPKQALTPADRCSLMASQLQQVIKARPNSRNAASAGALHRQGDQFCLQKKWAQGLRSYATGLKMLGSKPTNID